MQYVFVLNGDGQPLSPCHPAVARKLLKKGRATIECKYPFAIRLVETKVNSIVQPMTVGIDDGAKIAGIVVIQHNRNSDRVVFKANLKLRNNVKKLLSYRLLRRRARRSRLRHRQPRHRRNIAKGWIPPSVRVRKDNVLRLIQDLVSHVPIDRIVYEEGQFDTRKLWDEDVQDYRQGPNSGFENRRMAVLARDGYVCQYCEANCIKAGLVAEVDHVIPHSRGGTLAWQNLVCSCQPCNQAKGNQTAEEFGYPKVQGRIFIHTAQTQAGKTYIKEKLEQIASLEVWYGWQTSRKRKDLGLIKSHTNDAIAMSLRTSDFEDDIGEFQVIARRRRQTWQNFKHNEYAGFRHWDIVEYIKQTGEKFLGTVRSFVPSRKVVKCRLSFNDNWPVSLGRLRLMERPRVLVYLLQIEKKEAVSHRQVDQF